MKYLKFEFFLIVAWVGLACYACTSDLESVPGPAPVDTTTNQPSNINPPSLVSYFYKSDSIRLIFDQEVRLLNIANDYEPVGEKDIKYVEAGKGIAFPCEYCRFGGDYSYRYHVIGKSNKEKKDNIDIGFYFKKVKVQGLIEEMYVDDDRKHCYLFTRNPNMLNVFSFETQQITRQMTLDFMDVGFNDNTKMAFNPHDGLFYFYSNFQPALFGYSIQTQRIEKTLSIIAPDISGESDHQYIYAEALQFTSSGRALAFMTARCCSTWRAGLLEEKSDGSVVAVIRDFSKALQFLQTGQGHDKIYLLTDHLNPPGSPLWRFNATGEMDSVQVPQTEGINFRNNFIKPHQNLNLLYVSRMYEQFIFNEATSEISDLSFMDARGGSTLCAADFSYAPNEEHFIYFYNSADYGELELLDYSSSTTIFHYGILDGLHDLYSTLDNEFLFTYKEDELYLFSIEKFRQDRFIQ